MGNSFDQYRNTASGGGGSSAPVGSLVQSPFNITDTSYLACAGQKVARAAYPELSAALPNVGGFTATGRTRPYTPIGAANATNGTLWVVSGQDDNGSHVYTTTDGITYTARSVVGAASDVRSLLYDGTNFVAADASLNTPKFSANGTTWSISASAVPATTPAAGANQTCMAWSPTLGTVGRFCIVNGTSGAAAAATSDDRGAHWTARTIAAGCYQVCWTGTKFIAACATANVIYTSADGISWGSQAMAISTPVATAGGSSIISDGAGRVLYVTTSNIQISFDHGVTWALLDFGAPFGGGSYTFAGNAVSYTNGRFFIGATLPGGATDYFCSTNLIGWSLLGNAWTATGGSSNVVYRAGVYLVVNGGSTGAQTMVEDTTQMRIPLLQQPSGINGSNINLFIKAS